MRLDPQGPGSTPWDLDFIQGRGIAGGEMSSDPRSGNWRDTRSGTAQLGVVPGLAFRDLGAPEGYPTVDSNYCVNCHPGRSCLVSSVEDLCPRLAQDTCHRAGGRLARSLTSFCSFVWLCL